MYNGNLWLHLDRESVADGNVYAMLMPTGAVPQPLPPGRAVVGNAYAIQFSGARTRLERPAELCGRELRPLRHLRIAGGQ